MGLYGSLFLLPLFLQRILGYPAMTSGEALIPRSLAMAVIMPLGGRFYNRLGPKIFVVAGLLDQRVFLFRAFPSDPRGRVLGHLLAAAMAGSRIRSDLRLPHHRRPGHDPAAADDGGDRDLQRHPPGVRSVGIAASATLLESSSSRYHAILSEHVTRFSTTAQSFLHGAAAAMITQGLDEAAAQQRALKLLDVSVLRQSAVLAYNHLFSLVAVLFIIGLPLVFFLKSPKGRIEVEAVSE